MTSPDVIVIGAGVLGLGSAAELAARGHAVTVIDPGGPNASAIAAGMIAPAMESLLEDASRDHAGYLKRAADLWPAFAERHGLTLHADGTEWRGLDPDGDLTRLERLGFRAEHRGGGLFLPDETRIDASPALERLSQRSGVTRLVGNVVAVERHKCHWLVEVTGGQTLEAAAVIVAIGAPTQLQHWPDPIPALLQWIEPIKGQVTRANGPPPPATLRSPNVYIAPAGDELLIGADMAWGRSDDAVDADALAWQLSQAERLLGRSVKAIETRVGVRGASPDDLPMAGGAGQGLFVALAPRRNGWLMAPRVAQTLADAVEGRAPAADAATLDPLRFL